MTESQTPKARKREKVLVSLYLSVDVIAYFKATGPGWQARINDVLRKAAGL